MTPEQKEPEYRITESQLEIFERMIPTGYQNVVNRVRSRPLTSAPTQDTTPFHFVIDAGLRAEVVETLRMAGCPCLARQLLEKSMPDFQFDDHSEIEEIARQDATEKVLIKAIENIDLFAERDRTDEEHGMTVYFDSVIRLLESLRAKKEEPG